MDVKHPFQVGGTYENRRGRYEVLAIHGGRIEVRFLDDGERKELDLATQARIWDNMQREERSGQERARVEREARAERKAARAEKAARVEKTGRKLAQDFRGMRAEDFSGDVKGTNWRSKAGLAGGPLRVLRSLFRRPFVPVAVRGWPVVFLGHRPFNEWKAAAEGSRVAKYTVQADPEGLYFGFYVEWVDSGCHDWDRFVERLPGLASEVAALEADGVQMEGRSGTGPDRCYYFNGPSKGAQPMWPAGAPFLARVEALRSPPAEGEWRELYLGRTLKPDEAIGRGLGLLEDVGEFFLRLAPFYRAAALDE